MKSKKKEFDAPDAELDFGGDAALLHLVGELDEAILRVSRSITTSRGICFKKVLKFLNPLKVIVLIWYTIST